MNGAVVIFSGGQDSTTCLYWAKQQGFDPIQTVSFSYAQLHSRELVAAEQISRIAGATHHVIRLGNIFGLMGLQSPLVCSKKLDLYENVEALPDGSIERTFVAGRNLLFLSLAASYAHAHGLAHLIIGVSQEDYGGYPDCRRDFIVSMQESVNLGIYGLRDVLHIHVPLIDKSKAATVRLAQSLPGCIEALKYSWTCYAGGEKPCGKCYSCLLRAKGFAEAGVIDPALGGNVHRNM